MELNKVLNLLTGVYDKCKPVLQNHLLEPMTDSTRDIIISEILDAISYENDILSHYLNIRIIPVLVTNGNILDVSFHIGTCLTSESIL